jgi:hypothetical protein
VGLCMLRKEWIVVVSFGTADFPGQIY